MTSRTTLREVLLMELPDATVIVRVLVEPAESEDSLWLAMAPRRDGLLHVRHLEHRRFPEELIGVPDLADRPVRGFWSDLVIAATRFAPPIAGAEILVGCSPPVAARLGTSPSLIVAVLLALVNQPEDRDTLRVLLEAVIAVADCDLPVADGLVASAEREDLASPNE